MPGELFGVARIVAGRIVGFEEHDALQGERIAGARQLALDDRVE